MPKSQAAVPRLRPQTNPTAANMSINNLLGLNCDEMPNSEVALFDGDEQMYVNEKVQ
jgi:hypothetical protein